MERNCWVGFPSGVRGQSQYLGLMPPLFGRQLNSEERKLLADIVPEAGGRHKSLRSDLWPPLALWRVGEVGSSSISSAVFYLYLCFVVCVAERRPACKRWAVADGHLRLFTKGHFLQTCCWLDDGTRWRFGWRHAAAVILLLSLNFPFLFPREAGARSCQDVYLCWWRQAIKVKNICDLCRRENGISAAIMEALTSLAFVIS